MKSGVIEVVSHGGELFFESEGILLDLLDAADFYHADIVIKRDGEEFDTGITYEMGTHAPVPIFSGFRKIEAFKLNPSLLIHQLLPEYFEEGDKICFALKSNFDWDVDYRKRYTGSMIHEKFKEQYDLMFDFVNDEDFEEQHKNLTNAIEQEISLFVFPENPIWRRKV